MKTFSFLFTLCFVGVLAGSHPVCEICTDGEILRPDESFPEETETQNCAVFSQRAKKGNVTPEMCADLQAYAQDFCCGPASAIDDGVIIHIGVNPAPTPAVVTPEPTPKRIVDDAVVIHFGDIQTEPPVVTNFADGILRAQPNPTKKSTASAARSSATASIVAISIICLVVLAFIRSRRKKRTHSRSITKPDNIDPDGTSLSPDCIIAVLNMDEENGPVTPHTDDGSHCSFDTIEDGFEISGVIPSS